MKTIKMVALVGSQEVVVGRCHPGQARILRSNGMAEWQKDKLILLQYGSIEGPGVEEEDKKDEPLLSEILEECKRTHPTPARRDHLNGGLSLARMRKDWKFFDDVEQGVGWGAYNYEKHIALRGLTEEDLKEIDPSQSLRFALLTAPVVKDIESDTLSSWVKEAQRRKEEGHRLFVCNQPKAMKLGFVDDNENLCFLLALRKLKAASDETFAELGINRSDLLTEEGRTNFFEADPFFGKGEFPVQEEIEIPEGVSLESLWISEVKEEMASKMVFDEFVLDSTGRNLVLREHDGRSGDLFDLTNPSPPISPPHAPGWTPFHKGLPKGSVTPHSIVDLVSTASTVNLVSPVDDKDQDTD